MYLVINKCVTAVILSNLSRHYLLNRSTSDLVFWVISVYFNVRNILLKSGTFPLGHPVLYIHIDVRSLCFFPIIYSNFRLLKYTYSYFIPCINVSGFKCVFKLYKIFVVRPLHERDIAVSIFTKVRPGRKTNLGCIPHEGKKFFSYSTHLHLPCGPHIFPFSGYLEIFFRG